MKILLIYPYFIEERIHREDIEAVPMGLYSVAAVLKENDHDVEVMNFHNLRGEPEKVRDILAERRPQIIGFSILHGNRWGGIEIVRLAKEMDPGVKIVFGGIGASCLWEHFLKHFPEIDYVVVGEGEYSFLSLVQVLEQQGNPEDVRGIAFRADGVIKRTDPPELVENLDNLPIAARHFTYPHVSSSRGCGWHCAFCGSPAFWGKKIRFRSPEHFVDELEILYWMRKAGCIQISYGIESGSETIRAGLKKKITTDQIKKAFRLTTTYGILSRAYFIYGSPGESWETIQETIDLMGKIKPLSVIFYLLDVFPGTDLYEQLKARSNVMDDIWLNEIEGIMYCETDPTLPDELILAFGKRLRTWFYEHVHAFAQAVELIDREDMYEEHADFCSRLGMTFSHGDYSKIDGIKEKEGTAEKLFRKSLAYHPNHRAYLGLGIVKQKTREYEESIKILREGLDHFPKSEELSLCLGISYMNLREYDRALGCFSEFPRSKAATAYAERCREAMNKP